MSLTNSAVRMSGGTMSTRVDPREPVFSGHYPGQPILPGVFVVDAVCRGVPDMVLTGVESAKFLRPVRPGDELVAKLMWPEPDRCAAVVTVHGTEVARMTLRFRPGGVL